MHYVQEGLPAEQATLRIIWAHGWGQSHAAFVPLVEPFKSQAHHILLDFPGFGQSPPPPVVWGVVDYAEDAAAILRQRPFAGKTIWVGHSFGCRVGIQLAATHPELVNGLFLIAGHGVPRKRSLREKLSHKIQVLTFKTMKHIWQALGRDVDVLRARFGSRDYRSAGALRGTFIKVVNEDLSAVAPRITCPTFLLYGKDDTETPPDIGQRLNRLIPDSNLVILDSQDHYSLLSGGRHQTLKYLQIFIKAMIA